MEQLELPYVAGLFDGEGWVTINKWAVPGRAYVRYQLIIGISLTEKPMIETLARQFGGLCATYTDPKRPTHRRVWTWRVSSKAAVPFLKAILPWLRIKRDQAALMLTFQEHMSANASVFKYQPDRRAELYEYRDEVRAELKRLHKVTYSLNSSGPPAAA